ncbi:MAG: HAD-IA family hydrolase [Vibrio sp.]
MDISNVKCVIFDCDGTLVDSEKLCCQALVQVFASYGAEISFEETMANFQGGKIFDILQETSQRAGLSIPMDVLEPRFRQQMSQLFKQDLKPMPYALETVQQLLAKGIDVCVASNGPPSKMQESLSLTGLLPYFENRIFSAFDINSWKPEPDLLMFTAMQMGFLVDECLFVDDTKNGINAGLNAGLKTVHYQSILSDSKVQPLQTSMLVEHPQLIRISCLSELPKMFERKYLKMNTL